MAASISLIPFHENGSVQALLHLIDCVVEAMKNKIALSFFTVS